jgi:hypothetical protein
MIGSTCDRVGLARRHFRTSVPLHGANGSRRDSARQCRPDAGRVCARSRQSKVGDWQVPNRALEQFATLARWRAVADYRFPIAIKDKIGGAGIDSDRAVTVIALDHGVSEIGDFRLPESTLIAPSLS